MAPLGCEKSANRRLKSTALGIGTNPVALRCPCYPQGEEFGEGRLAAVIAEHRNQGSVEIVQAVNRAIADFTAGTPLPDDLTLLVTRRTA